MKNRNIIAGILIVVLLALCAAGLFAAWQGVQMANASGITFRGLNIYTTSAKATEQKNLTVTGPVDLTVENDLGAVGVQIGPEGQVSVQADKTAWGSSQADAQAALKKIKVIVTQDGNAVHVSVEQPAEVTFLHIGPGGGSVNFTLTVPPETAADLHSQNGDVSLAGTTGAATVRSDFGSVTLTDVSGSIQARSINGSLTAKTLSGGAIDLSSDFGSVTFDGGKGSDVSVSSSNGRVSVTNVQATGALKADSQFGDVTIQNSQAASADVHSSNGAVRLTDLAISGEVAASSSFGALRLDGVKAGSYDLTTQNGQLHVDGAQGPIKAHSDFGAVEVVNAQNATLDLSSNNGSVTFSGSLGTGPHTVRSDFGDVRLTLPADTALTVDLQTSAGKISSDFKIAMSGEVKEQHWVGTLNGGGAQLAVKTSNGNIVLQSSR